MRTRDYEVRCLSVGLIVDKDCVIGTTDKCQISKPGQIEIKIELRIPIAIFEPIKIEVEIPEDYLDKIAIQGRPNEIVAPVFQVEIKKDPYIDELPAS